MKEEISRIIVHCLGRVILLIRWLIFSGITGLVVGLTASFFLYCMNLSKGIFDEYGFLIFFIPVGGVIISRLYGIFGDKNTSGTNQVILAIHSEEEIPIRMAPLIFISTVLTHMFGGSSGREGAALQLGGSIGNQLGKWFRFDEKDRRVVIMCGMSAAFSAIFGTPIAASVFSMEVVSVGVMYYVALVPCVVASLIARKTALALGFSREIYPEIPWPDFSFSYGGIVILLAIACALISVLFCLMLRKSENLFIKFFPNSEARIIVGSFIIMGLVLVIGSRDYCGVGMEAIMEALLGNVVLPAFLLKMILTSVTLGCGFRGGEIIPSIFIGATFGCLFGKLMLYLPLESFIGSREIAQLPAVFAALGLTAIFCGVTNCPITSILISFELFGMNGASYIILVVAISYMLSGYFGLYSSQKIVYSKYKTEYINQKIKG